MKYQITWVVERSSSHSSDEMNEASTSHESEHNIYTVVKQTSIAFVF